MDLNDAYANMVHIDGAADYPVRWAADAAAWRDQARSRLDIPYGTDERQKLDLFLPDGDAKGLVVFIHGGYWRAFDRKDWSHLAAGCIAHGWAVAMPSYRLAPDVGISDITQDMVAAMELAAGEIDGAIVVTGHSAGGQLTARMVCKGVGLSAAVQGRIMRAAPISPLSDLRPLMGLDMNDEWQMDQAEAEAESAVLGVPVPGVSVDVWVGADERPAFLDQAGWLAQAWDAGLHVEPGKHHFDVIDALCDPKSAMITNLLRENRVTG